MGRMNNPSILVSESLSQTWNASRKDGNILCSHRENGVYRVLYTELKIMAGSEQRRRMGVRKEGQLEKQNQEGALFGHLKKPPGEEVGRERKPL